MDKWRGKIAVVTGASSGIGAAIAKDLACHGLTVIGLARRSEKVEKLSSELAGNSAGKIIAHKCDVSDHESRKSAFKWIEENFSVIHVLINNAGSGLMGSVLDNSDEMTAAIERTIDVNFTALVHCTREAVQLMKKSSDFGFIVNVSSIFGHEVPCPNHSNLYPATKFAVRAMSEIFRQDLIQQECGKIRVTNLSPGLVKTEIIERSGIKDTEAFFQMFPALQPEDVAATVVFLLSTPVSVNITELTIRPTGEFYEKNKVELVPNL
jgi:NADP+-dependent farnesol dehydrogenase